LELDSNFKEAQKLLTELKGKMERSKKRNNKTDDSHKTFIIRPATKT
jgi:Holliday junction resolvasome RuvABC DNA-binding subunit